MESEDRFQLIHSTYAEKLNGAAYVDKERLHAYVIEIRDSCQGSCHAEIQKVVRRKRLLSSFTVLYLLILGAWMNLGTRW